MERGIKNVCIVFNVYALLQYLLSQSCETIKDHTYYFFGEGVPASVRQNFQYHTCFETVRCSGMKLMRRRFLKLKLRLFSNVMYPFVRHAAIFAQDHLYFSSLLIGRKDYILLSDSQYFFSYNVNPGKREYEKYIAYQNSLKYKIMALILGPLSIKPYGFSDKCKGVYLTIENECTLFANKYLRIRSFEEDWRSSDKYKKRYILSLFNVTEKDIVLFSKVDVVILTQPFYDDLVLSENENLYLYNNIIERYKSAQILFKVHPRDTCNYEAFDKYSGVTVYKKPIPMELMAILGIKIKTVVTFFSSSAFCFTAKDVKIDWLGTKNNYKLKAAYGEF